MNKKVVHMFNKTEYSEECTAKELRFLNLVASSDEASSEVAVPASLMNRAQALVAAARANEEAERKEM